MPGLTTYQAIGVVPEGHPQHAGPYTNGGSKHRLSGDDLILAVGLDLVKPIYTHGGTTSRSFRSPRSLHCAQVPITVEVPAPPPSCSTVWSATACSGWPRGPGLSGARCCARLLAGTRTRGNFGPLELAAAVTAAAPSARRLRPSTPEPTSSPSCRSGRRERAGAPLDLQRSGDDGVRCAGRDRCGPCPTRSARLGRMVGDGGLAMTLAESRRWPRLQLPGDRGRCSTMQP